MKNSCSKSMSTICSKYPGLPTIKKVITDQSTAEGKITPLSVAMAAVSPLFSSLLPVFANKAGIITLNGVNHRPHADQGGGAKIALLPQTMEATDGISHLGLCGRSSNWLGPAQYRRSWGKICWLWKQIKSANFDWQVDDLSGGQRQRV